MMLHQTSTHGAEAAASKTEPSSGSGESHPTAKRVEMKTWRTCQVEALAKLNQGSAATLTDSDDVHLTVQLLYQPFITKRQASDGCWHNDPIHVQQSADTFANALALLKKVRVDAGDKPGYGWRR